MIDWPAAGVTAALAICTTAILIPVAVPLAMWMVGPGRRWARLLLVAMLLPLLLPPTVLGYVLLVGFAPQSPIGGMWHWLTGTRLAFSFPAILLASLFYNLPFALGPIFNAFASIPQRYLEHAQCLGLSRWQRWRHVAWPLAWPGVVTATLLTAAHCVGEFGVVLMVGGNRPGETRTLSLLLYDQVLLLDRRGAAWTAGLLAAMAFGTLLVLASIDRPQKI